MESKINTVGLTIWGYKQGCKVLASQGVNFQLKEVKDRLKDLLRFLPVHTRLYEAALDNRTVLNQKHHLSGIQSEV